MDPQTSTSFIPKKSFDEGRQASGAGIFGNLIFLAALFIFVVSLILAGGAFAYLKFLNSSIVSKAESLHKAEQAFDPGAIQDLVRLDTRITNARILLTKHVASSAIFDVLGSQTLETVQFNTFDYTLQTDGSAQISLAGIAASFSAVALQSDQFGSSKVLKDVVFSGIAVDTRGKVSFSVKATVSPVRINYAKTLMSQAAPSTGVAPQTTPSPSPAPTQ